LNLFESKIAPLDHPLQRYGHSRMLGGIWNPILGEGEVVGVSDSTIRKSDGSFL